MCVLICFLELKASSHLCVVFCVSYLVLVRSRDRQYDGARHSPLQHGSRVRGFGHDGAVVVDVVDRHHHTGNGEPVCRSVRLEHLKARIDG